MKNAVNIARVIGLAGVFAVAAIGWGLATDRSALWNIAHGKCEPRFEAAGDPKPCALVDVSKGEANGFVVLKDLVGGTQFLLIPTRRIAGIESPDVVAPDAPDWFADAWDARRFLFERLGRPLPRDNIALAINSAGERSQDQLHIHIDCLRRDVRDRVAALADGLGEGWSRDSVDLAGSSYRALKIARDNLGGLNPFRLVAEGLPEAKDAMGQMTIVVVGAGFRDQGDGFVVLAGRGDAANPTGGHGEDLQDHACAIGR